MKTKHIFLIINHTITFCVRPSAQSALPGPGPWRIERSTRTEVGALNILAICEGQITSLIDPGRLPKNEGTGLRNSLLNFPSINSFVYYLFIASEFEGLHSVGGVKWIQPPMCGKALGFQGSAKKAASGD